MTKTERAIFWSAMPSNANLPGCHIKNLQFGTLGTTFGRSVFQKKYSAVMYYLAMQ